MRSFAIKKKTLNEWTLICYICLNVKDICKDKEKKITSPKEFGYFKTLPSNLRQIHIAMNIAEIISLGKQLVASVKDMN